MPLPRFFGLGTNKFTRALASALLSFWDFESSLKVKSTNVIFCVAKLILILSFRFSDLDSMICRLSGKLVNFTNFPESLHIALSLNHKNEKTKSVYYEALQSSAICNKLILVKI